MSSGKVRDSSGNSRGSRISFAPGTSFDERGPLYSFRKKASTGDTFNLRPVSSDELLPQSKFSLPKATLPSLRYLSVTHEDFLDPRFAEDVVKSYGIPKYFFRSKSNLLVSPPSSACLEEQASIQERQVNVGRNLQDFGEESRDRTVRDAGIRRSSKKQVEIAKNMTSSGTRLPAVVTQKSADQTSNPRARLRVERSSSRGLEEVENMEPRKVGLRVAGFKPLFKPLIGEMYTQEQFSPHMNPWRSLQMESETKKYVEHKKRCGLWAILSQSFDRHLSLGGSHGQTRQLTGPPLVYCVAVVSRSCTGRPVQSFDLRYINRQPGGPAVDQQASSDHSTSSRIRRRDGVVGGSSPCVPLLQEANKDCSYMFTQIYIGGRETTSVNGHID